MSQERIHPGRKEQILGAALSQHFHWGHQINSSWKWKDTLMVEVQSRLFTPDLLLFHPALLTFLLFRALWLKVVPVFIFLTPFPRNLLLFPPQHLCRIPRVWNQARFWGCFVYFSDVFSNSELPETLRIWLGWISSIWTSSVLLISH